MRVYQKKTVAVLIALLATVGLAVVVARHHNVISQLSPANTTARPVAPQATAKLVTGPSNASYAAPTHQAEKKDEKKTMQPSMGATVSTRVQLISANNDDQYEYYYNVMVKNSGTPKKNAKIVITGSDGRGKMCSSNLPSENSVESIAAGESWEAVVAFTCNGASEPHVHVWVK